MNASTVPAPRSGTTTGVLMLGLSGLALDSDDVRRLMHPQTAGAVLFGRNFTSRSQLSDLVDAIRQHCPHALIAVDHEGGRVQPLCGDGISALPSMGALGEMWNADPLKAVRAATDLGYLAACELLACGIDLSFSPVLDLDHGRCAAIGDRAFHRDPRTVALLAKSLSDGMAIAGMASCGKHFPGHGYVEVDEDGGIPVDYRGLEEILADDAAPFGWMGLSLPAAMPAYVIYPEVDSLPAGFSRKWLAGVLRERLGFDGAIFAEDLGMEGARMVGDVVEGGLLAIEAGCDLLVLGNRDLADRLLDGLVEAGVTPSRESTRRIQVLRPRAPRRKWADLQSEPRYLAAKRSLGLFEVDHVGRQRP